MQLTQITRSGNNKGIYIKIALFLIIVTIAIVMLSKVDFPSPNKDIEKTIPNEKLKIVK
jgi:uncharacterized membrane protein YidH (DUF202 family)|tara:strand:+ start:52 stop:228 length:177 start_codon:yes stop_codon:yes gene_type:complete